MPKKYELIVIADGDPLSIRTNSGVARGMFLALSASKRTERVDPVNSRLAGLRRVWSALRSFRPNRRKWWATYNFGPPGITARSRWRDAQVDRLGSGVGERVLLHVRNVYRPSRDPYVAFIDSTSAMAERGWSPWVVATGVARERRLKMEAEYYQNAIAVVTAGHAAARSVVEDYGVDACKVKAIGGGVNFDELPSIRTRSIDSQKIIWVGMDFVRKGGDILVAAFDLVRRTHPQSELILVGDAPDGLPTGVRAVGAVRDRQLLRDLYQEADIFALPARHEPYGLVLQEAMAFALPAVVSEIGELPTIIGDSAAGIVVPGEDVRALAGALRRLLDDAELRVSLGNHGRLRVERELNWDAVVSRLMQVLDERL